MSSTAQLPVRSVRPLPGPPSIPGHELLRRIGRGSYGEVWLGRQISTGAWHAIKLVHRDGFEEARPFEREFDGIRACEPISHGHEGLIDILQVGRDEKAGYFYYVMELADDRERGREVVPADYQPRTLRSELLARGRLPLSDCLAHGRTLARALAHLHGHGLVHRDIKPSNIVFVDGVPKLADIGLVTSMDATFSWVGTPGYLPREGPGQPAADIFSLGKVIYEIATGKDRHDFPELPEDVGGLRHLNELLLRACARHAEDRHESAVELAADFERVAAGRPPLSRARTVRRRVAALVGSLVLAGAALFWADRQRPNLERGLVLETTLPGQLQIEGTLPALDHRGQPGGALFFDGATDRATLPLSALSTTHATLGPDVTVAAWMKSLSPSTAGCIAGVFHGQNAAHPPAGFWLEARDHGGIVVRQRQAGGPSQLLEAGSDQALTGDGAWHLVMGTSRGGRLRLYIDGRAQADTTAGQPLAPARGVFSTGHSGLTSFRGVVGRVWVFNRALSAAEARLLFDRQRLMDPHAGLVAHYPLDGGGEDISGHNRHLHLRGCEPAPGRNGQPRHALGFDGLDDWAGLAQSGAPSGQLPRTLAIWARRSATQPADRVGLVVTGQPGTGTDFGLELFRTNGVARARPGLTAPFPAGQWLHLAATYDGRRTRLYLDGQPAGQSTEPLANVPPRLFLGVNALTSGGAGHFRGALDELRIYNRALSPAEIAALVLLENPSPPPARPAVRSPACCFPTPTSPVAPLRAGGSFSPTPTPRPSPMPRPMPRNT